MSGSEDQWYRPNHEAGIVLFLAGLVSTLAWLMVPYVVKDPSWVFGICLRIMSLSVMVVSAVEIVKHWK